MGRGFFCLLLLVVLLPVSVRAEDKEFHRPQTAAEASLNEALWIKEIYPEKELKGVLAWLDGKQTARTSLYKDYFTRSYLKKWSDIQVGDIAVCKKNTTPADGVACEARPLNCNFFSNSSLIYTYRTLKISEDKAVIALSAEGWNGNGGAFSMVKEDGKWKIDGTECTDDFLKKESALLHVP